LAFKRKKIQGILIIFPLIAAGGPIHFFLDEKVSKKSRKIEASAL
jgi:hypothetical protein